MSVWRESRGNTKNSDRDVCNTIRARALWVDPGEREGEVSVKYKNLKNLEASMNK